MNAIKILVADKLAREGLEYLKAAGLAYDERVGLKEAKLASAVPEYDALIIRGGANVTAKVLERPGKLRAIARAGVGVDNIDVDAATGRGILVLNTAGLSALLTAEHALALLMSLARRIPQADHSLRQGRLEWQNRIIFQGIQLANKTLGVVGLGQIGQAVARRGLAMEMTVIGWDPYFSAPTALDGRVRLFPDFDEFLGHLDMITFHLPRTGQTRHLLSRERLFNQCRSNLLVVNVANSELIDEGALADALKAGKIAGAALDVYAIEPPPRDHPLFDIENAILTPHVGALAGEAATAVHACKAIAAFLQTGEIRDAVNAVDLPAN